MPLRQRAALSIAVSLLTLYGPMVAWMQHGTAAAFLYFAPDAFYYLQIADQAARTGLHAFDGVHTTTGFHPLWGFLLGAAFTHIASLQTKDAQMLFTLALSTALTAAGLGLLAFAFTRFIRNSVLAFVVLVPGIYYLVCGWAFPPAGNNWSFINGLETAPSILAFGIFAILLPTTDDDVPTPRRLVGWSFVLALMVLARLDDVFLVAAVIVAIARRQAHWRERAVTAIACGAVPAIAITVYVAYNLSVSGHMLPSSAAVKEGSSLLANLHLMALPFAPFGLLLLGPEGWSLLASKALHLLFPLAAAIIWLRRRTPMSLELLALYVVIKNTYNLAFVWIWHQGFWYFPLTLLIAGLLVVVEIEQHLWKPAIPGVPVRSTRSYLLALGLAAVTLLVIPFFFHGGRVGWTVFAGVAVCGGIVALWGPSRWWIVAALTAWGLFMGTSDVLNRVSWKYGDQYTRFWNERETLRRDFEASPLASPIVEFDDGVVTYGLSVQGMSGFGLAADSDAVAAKRNGRLLDLAYERGFRNIGSLYYVPPLAPDARAGSPADAIVARIPTMETEALGKWKFSIVVRDERSGLLLVRFDPR
jgi:hypothetical protein